MKSRLLAVAVAALPLFVACQKSEISDKPAAEVTETSATTAAATDSTTSATTAATPGAVTSNVIKDKSLINWVAGKVTRDHHGKFAAFDGSIAYAAGKPTGVKFDIDLSSIETDDPKLTGHLKSPDFFDVAKYPKGTFTSTSLTEGAPSGSPAGTTHTLKGTLDLHGMQKEVTIPVTATTSADGVRTKSEFTINRHDWAIDYKGAADDLIKDNVLIKLDLLFPPPPAA